MPKFSVKKPFTVVVGVIMLIVLGIVSFTRMTTDLLPEISLPYILVITTYPGASPERVESDVTEVLESSLGTVNGVENVTSTSSENYSMVILEFSDNTNMDSAMVKVSTAINQLSLPELCGTPMLLEMSPDMLPTMMVSVSMDDTDIYELTDLVTESITPYLERQEGVASVDETGLVEKSVEIRLDQILIDNVNRKLRSKVTETMDDAESELDSARQEILDAQKELDDGVKELEAAQQDTTDQLAETSKLLDQAMATQSAYSAQVAGLEASKAALEMEKQAYTEHGVVESYQQINDALASFYAMTVRGGEGYDTLFQTVYDQAYQTVYDSTVSSTYDSLMYVAVQASLLDLSVEADEETRAILQSYADNLTAETADGVLTELTDRGWIPAEQAADIRTASSESAAATAELTAPTLTNLAAASTIEEMHSQLPADVADAVANPEKLEYVKTMMASMGSGMDTSMLTVSALSQLDTIVNTRIPQIDTEVSNLQVELAAANAVLEQVNQAVQEAVDQYETLEAGKITAAIQFAELNAQMTQAQTALDAALTQVEDGYEALSNARETALESANLDALLSMDVLSGLIYAQNFSMPAGYIYEGDNQYLLKVGEEYATIEELEDSLLCTIDGVGDVRLKDVAYVTVIDNAGDSYARMDGEDAVILSIYKSSTAGTSAVSKTSNQAIRELEEKYEGLHITSLMDQGDYIKMIVNEVMSNLIWGAVLAIIVLALFLKDVKPTIVVAFSIPISVLFAIVLMYFTDITLNIISLSGLALGIGMLVDNSIVVIENIYRLRSQGIPAARAAVKGANQVAGAIFASTLTTVCVFLPIVFTTGLTRQLFTDMALTIAYSLLASLVVALTVVPAMGATVLKNNHEKSHRIFDRVMILYEKSIRFCLRWKVVPLLLTVGLLAFSVWQVTRMGLILIPEMGGNQMSVTVSAPEEASTEEAYAMADELMEQFGQLEGVDTVGAMAGGSAMSMMSSGSSSGPVRFSFYIILDEEAANDNTGVVNAINEIIAEKELEGSVSTSNMDMSSLMASGLQIEVYGTDTEQMLAVSEDMMALLGQVEGFTDITNGQEDGDPQIKVVVDKDKAMALGLTVAQVYADLASRLTTEATATTLTVQSEEYSVIIVDETDTVTLENLMDQEFTVTVMDEEGNSVEEVHTLDEFATEEESNSLASISRVNQSRYLTVSAVTEDGYNTTLLSRQVEALLDRYQAPEGITIEIAGESTTVMDAMADMLLMIGLAIVFIYLIMVAQFQSLLSPFIVLFTIPLAFTGGLLALLLSGEQLSMIAMMGFLVLAGVVVNNGIVFVDYANQLRLEGSEKREALVETGKTRMRPILMTALTTILAMTTMAFSKDAAAAMGKGMAIVTIGGLSYATLMTLYIVPVLYDLLFRRELKKVDLGDDIPSTDQ